MTKFVVEEELEKVKDKETQKLLEEVISCYSNVIIGQPQLHCIQR